MQPQWPMGLDRTRNRVADRGGDRPPARPGGVMRSSAALRERLAGELSGIADRAWVSAVAEVPREAFVGDRYYEEATGTDGVTVWQPVLRDGQDGAWLEAVYTDQTLVTQISGTPQTAVGSVPVQGWPTSS